MKTAESVVRDNGRNFVTVAPQTTILKAIRVMVDNKIGSVLIKEKDEIVGIWTGRDLMRNTIVPGFDPKTVPIKDCMTTGFRFVSHVASIYKLLDMFSEAEIRHLIVERDGEYIGLLSEADVNKAGLIETSKEYKSLFEHVGCGVFISVLRLFFCANINPRFINTAHL